MGERLYAIGHISRDIGTPDRLGGGVSYSGVAAIALGMDVTVLTKATPGISFLSDLESRGPEVINLATSDGITTFANQYDQATGRRQQMLFDRQTVITPEDVESIQGRFNGSVFLAAPVMAEVDTRLFSLLSRFGHVFVTPQGYFRQVDQEGRVLPLEWEGFEGDLRSVAGVILSDEDISGQEGQTNDGLLERIKKTSPLTILTQGPRGSTVFSDELGIIKVHPFGLHQRELVDYTGAGDSFAAAFLVHHNRSGKIRNAAVFASFYAALKIRGLNGLGLDSVPSREQIDKILANERYRIRDFLELNNASLTNVFIHQNAPEI